MYTALSRTTKFDYIHLDNNKLKSEYECVKNNNILVMKPRQTEFKDGKIYRIDFDNEDIYIGSTICSIEKRFEEHLNEKKSVVFKNKDNNPKISLLCNYPCYDKSQLELCEAYYINHFAKIHGDKVLNKRMNDEKKTKKEIKFKCS